MCRSLLHITHTCSHGQSTGTRQGAGGTLTEQLPHALQGPPHLLSCRPHSTQGPEQGPTITHTAVLPQVSHVHTHVYTNAAPLCMWVRTTPEPRECQLPCPRRAGGGQRGTAHGWPGAGGPALRLASESQDTWALGNVCVKCTCANKHHDRRAAGVPDSDSQSLAAEV